MEVQETHKRWIVTVDERQGRILECSRLPNRHLRLQIHAAIHNEHEGEHAHQRPMMAGGLERRGGVARSGAHAAPHMYAPGHGPEEENRRFAREVANWITSNRAEAGPSRVTVFAPPRFMGLLRELLDEDATLHIREAELTRLTPEQLASHHLVQEAIAF